MRGTVLVTGASRGIGKAVAIRCARAGYRLILTCLRSGEELGELGRRLAADCGVYCETFVGDMGSDEDVGRLFDRIGELDVLVNNAGVSYRGLLTEMSVENWRRVMATNLDAVFYTSRRAVPLMLRKRRGRIINVSSIWGNCGASLEAAYSASKSGVNGLTRALAKELAPNGIQVNAVACGVIDTEMNGCLTGEERAELEREIPANRFGTPDEAAELILQLMEAPDYLTGQVITLDGGFC